MSAARIEIQTPEGIVFPLILAGPVTRFLALVVDLACVAIVSGAVSGVLSWLGALSTDVAGALWILASFALSLGYGIALEWLWNGQTLGKRLLRIQVMDEQGLRLAFPQIAIRNLLRFVDSLPLFYLVGGAAAVLSPRAQRLGDIAAGTIVVSHPKVPEPDLDQILPGKFNSFREHRNLAARLRQNVLPREAAVALEALARRDALEPDARVRLFAAIRARLEGLVRFPAEAVEGLSDEQYVRNAADLLFRDRP
jgi:uncharacterized RDD family membrane protein YckC